MFWFLLFWCGVCFGEVVEIQDGRFFDVLGEGGCVVKFYAEWCRPCQMSEEMFWELSEVYEGIVFAKWNVEKGGGHIRRFLITNIPTYIFFVSGVEVDRMVGSVSRASLEKKLKSLYSLK